ncbi:MAG: hypothetical protein QOC95_73 [Thermoleophilaceae bacterium]|jgi:hypothetical protein|nr:hypothetical protein [Thermoleophilaceae bacterium]
MAEPPRELVEELYGAPLGEFTALRDSRAKELRKDDRAAAEALKKLRKPSVPAWAVNQLSRRARDGLESLLAAGEALRQAQLGGGDRDAIRTASRDEREAVEQLVREAERALRESGRGPSAAALEDVRETLHAAASDDEARDLIERGVLTEARQAVGLGGGGGFGAAFAEMGEKQKPAPKKGRPAKGKGASKAGAGAEDAAQAERQAEAERKRAARERAKAARAGLKAAEKAARDAGRAADTAERERDSAQEALDRAEEALALARRDSKAVDEQVDRARRDLESAADGE